jgi:hypothetical protein
LPFPFDSLQFIAFFNEECPDLFKHSNLAPMLKVPMERAVTAKNTRDMIPLATGPQSKNDAIQHPAAVNPVSPSGLGRIGLIEQRFDAFPQSVGYFPQSGQSSFALGHNPPP